MMPARTTPVLRCVPLLAAVAALTWLAAGCRAGAPPQDPAAAAPAPAGGAPAVRAPDAKAMEAGRDNAVRSIQGNPNLTEEQKAVMARQINGNR